MKTCCVIRCVGAALVLGTRAEPVDLDCCAAAALRPVKRLGCGLGALVEASGCGSMLTADAVSRMRILQPSEQYFEL